MNTQIPLFRDDVPVYTLTRSRRRTIAIHIHDNRVEVRAPLRAAQRDIDSFLLEKSHWITRKLEEQQQRSVERFCIDDGSTIALMGEALTVRWQQAGRNAVVHEDDTLWITGRTLDADRFRRLFLRWLVQQAGARMLPLAQSRIEAMGLLPRLSGFTLRYTRSLWGRCSASGNILFNPLVLLAPPAVTDYLIVHEACHLRHMNHSPAFWSLVAQHCDHWQASRRWLREHGHRLRF